MIKLYGELESALRTIPKSVDYLDLDLSGCTTDENYFYAEMFLERMRDRVVSLILPDSIQVIHDARFINLQHISGNNVLSIEEAAFYRRISLESIDLPSVISIGEEGFYCCLSLKSVNFPNVKRIDYQAFAYCESLESINIPKIHEINNNVFFGCKVLKEINLYRNHIEEFMPGVCKELFD